MSVDPIALFSAAAAILGLLATAWWRISLAIEAVRTEAAEEVEKTKRDCEARIVANTQLISLVTAQLNEFRVKVAEDYVSSKKMEEAISQVLREMKAGFDHVAERMDDWRDAVARGGAAPKT